MLNEHLIAKFSPVAHAENVVFWKDYRITVLSNRLFRLEKSPELKFRDYATQSVWFRNMEKQEFSVSQNDNSLTITTTATTLQVFANREDCRVIIDGQSKEISNELNLKGTYRTLDKCNGNKYCKTNTVNTPYTTIELGNGVCSLTGVAVHDDSNSLSLSNTGEVLPEKADGSDEYIFAFGNDYLSAINALFMITGKTPLIPRFALGNWWSRYHAYTDHEYLRLLTRFEERQIPLTVATVDMDWHWSKTLNQVKKITESGKNTEYHGFTKPKPTSFGWTGYSWNTELFPDYKAFLKELHARGLKVTLNLHPADGVRYTEDMYEQMALAMGVDPKSEQQIKFDITDTKFINNYFSILHKPYEKDGVNFWWIDWQQGTNSNMQGLDPLWALNHYHYLDNGQNNNSPLILSRYSGVGSHRYPLGFSGDTFVTWQTLKYLTYFTPTASNVGYCWWSHDIGGHYNGYKNHELFVRHVQFGVFSPINRLHCSHYPVCTKEPWVYKNGTGAIVEDWLKLRHKLIPLIYTASKKTTEKGIPLISPLYYYWNSKKAYTYPNEYVFAEQLLVAPVITPKTKNGYSRTKVWLPQGVWTDIFTGDKYVVTNKEGKTKTMLRTLESIPVLIKEGGVIPLSNDKGNGIENPTNLEVWAYTGNGEYTLYEDDVTSNDKGEFLTKFTSKKASKGNVETQTLTIEGCGQSRVLPKTRTLKVIFKDVDFNGQITLKVNGKATQTQKLYTYNPTITFAFEPNSRYEIEVTYSILSKLNSQIVRANEILTQAEGKDKILNDLYIKLSSSTSIKQFTKIVRKSKVNKDIKDRLLEQL